MTSEVLMLNKDAVVIAADSAVTTGREPHPRYSKAANKIFDLSVHGNVAVTIFSAAEVDRVPWELALKLFRKHDSATPQRPRLRDYVDALCNYLQANPGIFPAPVLSDLLQTKFLTASGHVCRRAATLVPDFTDACKSPAERAAAWGNAAPVISSELAAAPYQAPLTDQQHKQLDAQRAALEVSLTSALKASAEFQYANVAELTSLAIECLVKQPTEFLGYTGLVFAGYGADEIFPSFVHIAVYGHINGTLLWTEINSYAMSHDNDAYILPFAMSSMIDRFTDGFDATLRRIVFAESAKSVNDIFADLNAAGVAVSDAIAGPIISKRHAEFMENWKNKNWEKNFHPLRRVLNSLSVSEMGHLAESLLTLEALRERVTSPSESVGGPIDVAVITKAEGLIWLKRKHFFDPQLNLRYLNRGK